MTPEPPPRRPAQVLIRGTGVAARCCAHLLERARIPVATEPTDRPGVPAILLGDATQALIEDVFERRNLFHGLPRIDKRIVAWGPGRETRILPHSAVVLSESELLDRLPATAAIGPAVNPAVIEDDRRWTIHTAAPLPEPACELGFGSRVASAVSVQLRPGSDRSACSIESVENGWLFLIPGGEGKAWLLSVGGSPASLLESSRLIAHELDGGGAASGAISRFPAFPRIADPLCGSGWLACGTAAMAFDPICGDGTGNAVREAILAAAVIRAAHSHSAPALLSHYRRRLIAGFGRHLDECRPFYENGHPGPWWRSELVRIDAGIAWRRAQTGARPGFRFRLNGFDLEPLAGAT